MTTPSKAERRAFLRERGWVRIGRRGAEKWQHPRFERNLTLAAAYLEELADPVGRPHVRVHVPPRFDDGDERRAPTT